MNLCLLTDSNISIYELFEDMTLETLEPLLLQNYKPTVTQTIFPSPLDSHPPPPPYATLTFLYEFLVDQKQYLENIITLESLAMKLMQELSDYITEQQQILQQYNQDYQPNYEMMERLQRQYRNILSIHKSHILTLRRRGKCRERE